MTRLAKAIRSRRESARTRRALNRAIERSGSKTMRDELIAMAHAQGRIVR